MELARLSHLVIFSAFPGMQTGLTCAPSVTIVNADRPFYFQIVDEKQKLALFAGTVRHPDPVAKDDLAPANANNTDCDYDVSGVEFEYPDYETKPCNSTTEPTLNGISNTTTDSSGDPSVDM